MFGSKKKNFMLFFEKSEELICISLKFGIKILEIETVHLHDVCLHFLLQPSSFFEGVSFLQQGVTFSVFSFAQQELESQANDLKGIKKKPNRRSGK